MSVANLQSPSGSSTGLKDAATPQLSTQSVPFGDDDSPVQSTMVVRTWRPPQHGHRLHGVGHVQLTRTAKPARVADAGGNTTVSPENRSTVGLRERGRHGAGTTITVRDADTLSERDVSAVSAAELRPPIRSSVLSAALDALQEVLREPPDSELWQTCARRLRAVTAAEQQRSRRHAAMALLLADVLSFTRPDDLRSHEAAREALQLGWRVLGQPFVSTDVERQVTRDLARAGWQLSLPYRGWVSSS
jgi:hypothetical protein